MDPEFWTLNPEPLSPNS